MTRPSHAALVEEVAVAHANTISRRYGRDAMPIGWWRKQSSWEHELAAAEAALAAVTARLSDVTPEMVEAWAFTPIVKGGCPTTAQCAEHDWRAMLAASPLAAGKD
jgi:hypothetical protein